MLMITGKFIYESYEPLIEYKKIHASFYSKNYWICHRIFISLISLLLKANFEWIIFSIGMGELLRGLTLLVSIREIQYKLSLKYVNLNFLFRPISSSSLVLPTCLCLLTTSFLCTLPLATI